MKRAVEKPVVGGGPAASEQAGRNRETDHNKQADSNKVTGRNKVTDRREAAGHEKIAIREEAATRKEARPRRRMRRGEVLPGSRWALVSGAGSGIGRCYARRLAALGYNLVLAGNRREPLEEVRNELAAIYPGRDLRIVTCDLARMEAARELHNRTQTDGIEIDVLINNAGMFSFLDILRTPEERIERILLLHDMTNTLLCRLYAADMARRGRGGYILNMSSYSQWMPWPGLALYSASKAYLRSFSVAFAREVREFGIRVTAVSPAGVATDLYGLTPRWQRIGLRLGVLISADRCARAGLRALWRGRRSIVPDWWNRLWIPLCKMLPMWVLRPVRRFTMQFQK